MFSFALARARTVTRSLCKGKQYRADRSSVVPIVLRTQHNTAATSGQIRPETGRERSKTGAHTIRKAGDLQNNPHVNNPISYNAPPVPPHETEQLLRRNKIYTADLLPSYNARLKNSHFPVREWVGAPLLAPHQPPRTRHCLEKYTYVHIPPS